MKKVITTMLVAAMVLSMAVPTSAATITRKKSTGTTASTTKVSGDYSLKMVDKTLQFIRGGKVVSSIETKDGKITLRKSSAGGISVVFTDANGKRRNITLGKQNSVALSGTFVQVSVDKALGSSFEVEMEKGSKVTNFYAKGAAKVTLNGSVTTLNVTSSNANVAANGTVSRAYAVNKKAISGMSAGKITQTSTGTSASGSVNTSTGSSSSSNTTVNSGSGSGSSSSGGSSGIIINGGGSNGGTNTVAAPKITQQPTNVEIEEGKTATLTIKATGTGKVSYQWYDAKTGKAITGATSSTLDVKPTETSSYYCMVTNTVGSKKATIRSITVTVTVKGQVVVVAAPVIKTEPADVTVEVGNPATLKVEVEAVAGLTPKYQWYTTNNDGATPVNTAIKDATDATYTVTPDVAGTTSYYCTIINENKDGVKSEPATSKTASITATAKVDDTDLKAAKAAVEALMNKEYPDMTTLENAIKEAAGTTVKPEIKLTEGEDGKVTGTVTLTKDGVKDPVVIDFTATIKAEPTENADLKAAKDAIEALNANSYADATAAINAIKAAVTNEKIDVNTDDVKENADKTRIVGDVVLTITVDGKPVTATAKFDAAVTQQGEAKAPTFTKDPTAPATGSNITLDKDTPVTLEVAANVDGSTDGITYQWYRSTSSLVDNASARVAIEGATSATYTLAPEDEGSFYFFAEATHTVGDKTASSFSKNVLLTVTVPAGSAVDKPTFKNDLTNGTQIVRLGEQKTFTVEVNTPSTPNTTPKYQWYVSTDPTNPLNGQPITGETSATLTVSNDTLGTASYYCVVTNVSTDDVDFNNRTATSKYETITVADTVGMRTVTAVNDATTGGTTKLNVTFTKEVIGLTAANFKVEGVEKSNPDGTKVTPKITLGEVESFSNNKSLYTLHVSGIDISGNATVEFIAPDGFTVSGTNPQTVAITAPTAPAEVLTVKEFTASKKNAQGETTQLKVTFDKAVSSTTPVYEVVMGDPATPITISKKTIDPADDHSVLLDVTLNSDKDDVEATLTKANDVTLATADQKKVTVERDTTAPFVRSASLTSINTEIELLMSEPLKAGQTLTAGDFTIVDDPSTGNTITSAKFKAGSNNTVIVLTADDPIDIRTMTLSYTKGATAIIDTAASENALAGFSGKVIDGAILPDTLEIQEVEVTAKNTAVVKMNAPIVVDPSVAGSLDNLFKATNKTTGQDLPIDSVALAQVETKARLLAAAPTPTNNGFTITFASDLPENAVVVISINPDATDVAEKITIDGKPEVKLPPSATVETPEVKNISATVADVTVSGIKDVAITEGVDVTITLADGAFVAITKDANVASWFTNLPTGMTAVAKEAVAEGDDKIVITIAGEPSAISDAAMEITIPAVSITGLGADDPLTVATNANAKFNITDAVAIESVVLSATPDKELTVDDTVPTIAVTPDTDKFTIGTVDYKIDSGASSADAPLAGKGGKEVVATVTLTAKDGFTFTGLTDAEVTGITKGTVAVTGTPGATAEITVTYKVAKEEIAEIEVGTVTHGLTKTTGQDMSAAIAAVKGAVTATNITVGEPTVKLDGTPSTDATVDLGSITEVTFEVVLTPDSTHTFKGTPDLTGTDTTGWSVAAAAGDGSVTLTYAVTPEV